MAKRKKRGKQKSMLSTLVILLIAVGAFIFSYFSNDVPGGSPAERPEGELTVYYIDVGQADCELIVCGDQSVLVDAGEAESADKVIAFIRDLGIEKLSCIIATHPHADHIGALSYIINDIGAEHILMPELAESNIPTTRTYERLMEAVIASDAEVYAAKPGEEYSFGDIHFTVYSPVFTEDKELNNMSIVFRLVYGGASFLFTGDAEKQVEKELLSGSLPLSADVVKVAHHGSKTSSTEDFVRAVHPSFAIVCCGDGTKNHPHADITERWTNVGATIYRTDYNGTVTVKTDGVNITVSTEK